MFTRIVVGDDGSPEGQDAVVLGAGIAAATGAGLTLLQAFAPFLISSPGWTDRRTQTRQAERQLSADRRRYAPHALTEVVADSNPARALRNHAKRWHADLVIIGSNHRAPVGRCSIGHVGRGLLEEAPCALAIAKRGLHEHALKLTSVAVGYDGCAESEIALTFADEIASGAGAELLIESLAPERVPPLTVGGWIAIEDWEKIREIDRRHALELSKKGADKVAARSVAEASVSDPGIHLRELSDSVDLMVIGSRRWGTIARVVLGGVGETLASDCGASLLITRRSLRHPNPSPAHASDQKEEVK